MNPLARRGFTQNWLNRFLYPNSRHLPKSTTSPCGGVLLFIVDGEGFEPISNETCRWHVSATSSKTGGYHHVCEANMQIKSLHLLIVRHLDCRALSCSRRMAACVIAAGPRPRPTYFFQFHTQHRILMQGAAPTTPRDFHTQHRIPS